MSAIPIDPNRTPSWKQHNQRLDKPVPVVKRKAKDLGIVDPWDNFGNAPEFPLGKGILPKVFEDYVQDNIAEYGGDPAAYACGFLAMHCGVLHASVEMQTRPGMDNWRAPNEHSLTLGKSGSNKSGMFKDLTKHQVKWQAALDAAQPPIRRRGAPVPPAIFTKAGSVEGMLRRIADNRGERLIIGSGEGMGFFMGAGAHHQKDGVTTMGTMVCNLYDCEPFTKTLVNAQNSFSIPKLCGTIIMATVFDKFSQWEAFPDLVELGMMARFTVGLISNPVERDPSKHVAGADKAMGHTLFKLRAMKDVRFALAEDAVEAWSEYITDKERRNAQMDEMGTSGLSYWNRKYDTRIISLASVLQAYEYVVPEEAARVHEVFDIPMTAADIDKVGGNEARQGKLVRISYENLSRAIDFVEGFLARTQEYFYGVAEGATEFDKELKNWVARRFTVENPDDANSLIITRNELTNTQGPMSVRARNGINEKVKEKQRRWIRALLDYGFIEVCDDKPGARKFRVARADDQSPNYRIRDEFFTYFENRRSQLRLHDEEQQGKLAILRERIPLRLPPKKKAPSEDGA